MKMIFEDDIFINPSLSKDHLNIIIKEDPRYNINNQEKAPIVERVTLKKASEQIIKTCNFIESTLRNNPDYFANNNPFEIEDVLIKARLLLQKFKPENCLALYRVVKILEHNARKTLQKRYVQHYL